MEELMYYVWQQKMFSAISLQSDEKIEILDPGLRNLDAGPDFFNAKIRVGTTVWAGNVEMHVRASDWFKHHHQTDHAYDNVIMHIVLQADAVIHLQNGETMVQAVMHIPDYVMQKYNALLTKGGVTISSITCAPRLSQVPKLIFHDWMTSLATERMLSKAKRVSDLTNHALCSWPEAFYVILCRSFGTGINSDNFERLARSLPLSYLQKHLDNLLQIEALLLGQGGFLNDISLNSNAYYQSLCKEYAFLKAKFSLQPMPMSVWKMARLRPAAFPTLRIACLARLLCKHANLFSQVMEAPSVDALCTLLSVKVDGYWTNHYTFYAESIQEIHKGLGQTTVRSLIINAVVPIMLAYAEWSADDELSERALALLESIPAENNRYILSWVEAGVSVSNAFDSQALLHLYKMYCDRRRCMNCRLGCWLLKH